MPAAGCLGMGWQQRVDEVKDVVGTIGNDDHVVLTGHDRDVAYHTVKGNHAVLGYPCMGDAIPIELPAGLGARPQSDGERVLAQPEQYGLRAWQVHAPGIRE